MGNRITIPKHGGHDPDKMNCTRAIWGGAMIDTIISETGTDLEDAVCDALADLMHWSRANGFDFAHELRRACNHFRMDTSR